MTKLLLVDDNQFEREGISYLLKKYEIPVQITEVSNGSKAIECLISEEFQILITDIKMPLVDGTELIKRVREFNQTIEIIVISGYNDFEIAKKILNDNVTNYLLKPINVTEFIETIKQLNTFKQKRNLANSYSQVVETIIHIVKQEYQTDLSLEEIANRVFLTSSYVSNIFKKEVGIGFNKFLNDYRLKKAQELLSHSNMKINDIAQYIGIPNTSYFNRVFKKEFKISPSEYRQKYGVDL